MRWQRNASGAAQVAAAAGVRRLRVVLFAGRRLEQPYQIRFPILGHDANVTLSQILPDDGFKGEDHCRPGENQLLEDVHDASRTGPQLGVRGGLAGFRVW
jgi:hypothetical protein